MPSVLDLNGKVQIPGSLVGQDILNAPPDVAALYLEARHCKSANAPTAAVMACRKLLMHLAVEKGADAGDSFAAYVEFLVRNGWVPPGGRPLLDYLRKCGNEANHEIRISRDDEAAALLRFAEMLLKWMYEVALFVPTAAIPTESTG